MVNHVLRFRLGVTLIVLGLIQMVVEGVRWIQEVGFMPGLLVFLGLAMVVPGLVLLQHKRSE